VIVVGVDGSEESKEALRWALAEARLRQTTLRAVCAWSVPAVHVHGYPPPPDLVDRDLLRDRAAQTLDAVVAEVAGEDPSVPVERITTEGSAAKALVAAAAEADLLVVGSRGHGDFAGLLLGSVSHQCAHHARCAVVIVRAQGRGG
jgi:nucleotide-binding universal stress UspA family protein